jgi:hypothetical protein
MVPPKIPYVEFSPVRLQGRSIRRGFPGLRQFASALRAFAALRYVHSGSESEYAVRSGACEKDTNGPHADEVSGSDAVDLQLQVVLPPGGIFL